MVRLSILQHPVINQMKKKLFLIAATLILFVFTFGMYKWLQQGHTFQHVWWSITNDWFVAITFFDALVFMTICIVWMCRDMRQRGFTTLQIILATIALILTGSVTFFVYLAYRDSKKSINKNNYN
jgi:uncharacterized BrkB/YihY/UPF0761 family membrane protein